MKYTDEQSVALAGDIDLTPDQLKAKYGGDVGEHPVATRACFEKDRKLFFGNPEYWRYVETVVQLSQRIHRL
jgi:hypothetical protein